MLNFEILVILNYLIILIIAFYELINCFINNSKLIKEKFHFLDVLITIQNFIFILIIILAKKY